MERAGRLRRREPAEVLVCLRERERLFWLHGSGSAAPVPSSQEPPVGPSGPSRNLLCLLNGNLNVMASLVFIRMMGGTGIGRHRPSFFDVINTDIIIIRTAEFRFHQDTGHLYWSYRKTQLAPLCFIIDDLCERLL